jgi:PAS domain-containing protein
LPVPWRAADQAREILGVSRDIAAAIRGESTDVADGFNHLLERQISQARGESGQLDLQTLLKAVSTHYDRIDGERRGIVRSMQLMSDEAQALTREIREQTASHLQAILDNVKDAIVTLDDAGHIETFNPTGERIFGYDPSEVLGRSLDFLLPDITRGAPDFLERFATRIDDTHVDRAALVSQSKSASVRQSSIGAMDTSSVFATSRKGILPSNPCAKAKHATARWWSTPPK